MECNGIRLIIQTFLEFVFLVVNVAFFSLAHTRTRTHTRTHTSHAEGESRQEQMPRMLRRHN